MSAVASSSDFMIRSEHATCSYKRRMRNEMIESWISSFYQSLNRIGFTDPVHAALVHMPIGLAVGAFLFGWVSALFGRRNLAVSAHHCAILALIFWFPAVLFGLADWQHFYNGAWLNPIKFKLILAGILFILLAVAVFFGRRRETAPKGLILASVTLAVITATLLGWFGARLVYGGKSHDVPVSYQVGEKIFTARCSGCHPGAGNVIDPDKPIRGASALNDPKAFISVLRNPKKPMPVFSPAQLSDQDAHELYLYITKVLVPSGQIGGKP